MIWWGDRKKRYRVVQYQNGKIVTVHGTGMREKDARRDAATVNGMLAWAKLMAPSGPRDAHATVELEDGPR